MIGTREFWRTTCVMATNGDLTTTANAPICTRWVRAGQSTRLAIGGAAIAALGLLLPAQARAQASAATCLPATPGSVGIVWQGAQPLTLLQIAGVMAPALWFSPDEPLLGEGLPPIPSAHPCDRPADHAVVYFQVTEIAYRGEVPVSRPEEDDPAFADKVESFILKYFFYYSEDSGVGGHPHDLETVEFEVWLEGSPDCRRVRVASVEGLAHGSRWYSNTLKARSDMKFPVMLLVEEGKHGTAPDRNADGAYMRGYDVTERVNDAWGVRDSLGQGVLLSSGYASEMTKPRRPTTRLLPPVSEHLQVTDRYRSSHDGEPSLGHYELRAGNTIAACDEITPQRDRLVRMMADHGFGVDQEPRQHHAEGLSRALSEMSLPDTWLSVSARVTERTLGAALIFKGLDIREGWIVPRFTISPRDLTTELLFTPSASRWADYYVSGGARHQYVTTTDTRTIETGEGPVNVNVLTPPNWKLVVETGFRFRAKLPERFRPFVLGYSFGGLRAGIQAIGFARVDQLRFVWEIGAGAW